MDFLTKFDKSSRWTHGEKYLMGWSAGIENLIYLNLADWSNLKGTDYLRKTSNEIIYTYDGFQLHEVNHLAAYWGYHICIICVD